MAKLQAMIRLGGVGFSASPGFRQQIQNDLTTGVIAVFRSRADLVRSAQGTRSYRMRRMSINPAGSLPVPQAQVALSRAAQGQDAVTAPQFEGGTSEISVAVSDSVEVE